MRLKVLGTGSSGNSYILSTKKEKLILDCGLAHREILRGIDYDLKSVSGVLVSHKHKDHALSANDFKMDGKIVFEPYKQEDVLLKSVRIGEFKIKSFDLPHDGVSNRGFLIEAEGQKVLYMTDFEFCKYNFKKLKVNHMLIECNYQRKFVNSSAFNFEHKVCGHCSLDYTQKFVVDNRTDELINVIMIHRGLTTTNTDECISAIKKVTLGYVGVYMAEPGMDIKLLPTPF